MRELALIIFVINLIAIIVLSVGFCYKFKKPKTRAMFGYCLVGSMFLYLISFVLITALEVFYHKNYVKLYFLIFIINPFIIGKLVKYETLKKYTVIQILFYVLSLASLFAEYLN